MEKKIDLSLCAAISRGFFGQVRYLIEFGSDVNERDTHGRTPLMLCALVNHVPSSLGIAQTLLEKGARVGYRDKLGLNALHYACIWEKVSLIRFYLTAVDYDLNQGDRIGNTVIFYTVDTGNEVILNELITVFNKYNLDLNKRNKYGETPLSQGLKLGHLKCVEILKNAGVEECFDEQNGDDERILPTRRERRISSSSSSSSLTKRIDTRKTSSSRNIRSASLKHEKQKIKCALPNDLRNDPEYMFNLRPIDCFVDRLNTNNSMNELNQDDTTLTGWRNDFRHLYRQYEVQCSPSWRQLTPPILSKAQSLHSLQSAGGPASESSYGDSFSMISTTKRALAHRRGLANSSPNSKDHNQKRAAAQHRLTRKGSNSNLSDSLNSSSESLNSSGKKQDELPPGSRRLASDELPPIKEMN